MLASSAQGNASNTLRVGPTGDSAGVNIDYVRPLLNSSMHESTADAPA